MAETDPLSGKEKDILLEGHDADGITEFDNDMPMWWLVGFVITVVFAFGYIVNYHMAQGPSSKAEYEQEVAAYNKLKEPQGAKEEVVLAALTDSASLDAGKTIYNGTQNTCATCHRNDLGGLVGPNLTDEYWIHGGDIAAVVKSIKTGYPDKGMQPYGNGARLTEKQVLQVASYILSTKGSNPPNPKAIDPAREIKFEPKAAEAEATVAKKGEKPAAAAANAKPEKAAAAKK